MRLGGGRASHPGLGLCGVRGGQCDGGHHGDAGHCALVGPVNSLLGREAQVPGK